MLTMMAIPTSSSSQFYRGGAIRYIRALGSSQLRSSVLHSRDPSRRFDVQVLTTSPSFSSSSSAASLPPSPSKDSSRKKHTNDYSSNNNNDASTVALFPWRSESTLLPRLNPEKVESIQQGLLLTSQSQTLHSNSTMNTIVTAYMFLNVPWYALLPYYSVSTFEHELATNISHAFVHGVAQLLVNVRNQSRNNNSSNNSSSMSNTNTAASEINSILIGGNDEDEDADTTTTNTNTLGIHFHETLEFDLHNDEDVNCATTITPAGVGTPDTTLAPLFQQKLINLYQASIPKFVQQQQRQAQQTHEERDDDADEEHEKETAEATNNTRSATTKQKYRRATISVDFQFGMVPYKTELVTLFSIPYISRTNIQTDKKLLALYQEMLEQPASHRPAYLRQLRSRYLDADQHAPPAEGMEMESTVIAQCLVWCHEAFAITDPCTGHVFQGSSSSSLQSTTTTNDTTTNTTNIRKIPHLVRMERTVVTKKDPRTGNVYNDLSLHDWIITDIDDVLHGNLIL